VGSNVAMLLTTRIVSRERELTLRAALGCGWGRQVRHLVLEAVVVFLAGGIGGLGVTWGARRVLGAVLPERMTTQLPMSEITIDWRVAAFAVGLSVVTGVIFGVISAVRTARSSRRAAVTSSRTISAAAGRKTAAALIVVELALATVLLGASVMVGGALSQIENRDIGFSTDRLLTAQFELSGDRLDTAAGHVQTLRALEERLGALPGVESVGTTTVNPLCCGDWGSRATAEGAFVKLEDAAAVNWRLVSPTFFETMGIRVLKGRVFEPQDNDQSEPVTVVDSRFAARLWPGEDAVGKRVKRGGTDSANPWMRVIGVVSAVEDAGEYTESWYMPYLQQPAAGSTDQLHVMLRVKNVDAMLAPIRRAVGEVDPGLAIIQLRTMTAVKMEALNQQRLGTSVATIFAALGAILALSGVYGLVAFVVAGSEKEMGIRMALGATAGRVMGEVLGRIGRLAMIGAVIGFAIAAFAQRHVIEALGAKPENFLVVSALMTALLILSAIAAATIPARRVLRVQIRNSLV
jgi:predicted permease